MGKVLKLCKMFVCTNNVPQRVGEWWDGAISNEPCALVISATWNRSFSIDVQSQLGKEHVWCQICVEQCWIVWSPGLIIWSEVLAHSISKIIPVKYAVRIAAPYLSLMLSVSCRTPSKAVDLVSSVSTALFIIQYHFTPVCLCGFT